MTTKSLLSISMILIFGTFCVFTSTASAGMFDLTFDLDIYGSYDDNLLLMSDEEIADYSGDPHDRILQVRPSFGLLLAGKRSFVRVKYTMFREWYDIHHDLNRTDNSFSNADLLASWDITDKLTLAVFDRYKDSLYGIEVQEIPEHRGDYVTNYLTPSIRFHDETRFEVTLRLNWSFMDYDLPPFYIDDAISAYDDWEEIGIGAEGYIELNSNTDIVVAAQIWDRDYENVCILCDSDSDGFSVNAGVTQRFGDGITVEARGEFDHREYVESSPGVEKTSYNNMGGRIDFIDRFSSITELKISLFSRFNISERYTKSFYRDTGIMAEFVADLSRRLEMSTMVQFSQLNYKNLQNEFTDDYFQAGLTLGYRFTDWASLRGRYQYALRDAEHNENDFEDNIYSLYVHLHYDFFR